jgi:hypothetical protein
MNYIAKFISAQKILISRSASYCDVRDIGTLVYTLAEQTSGNITDTVHISLLIFYWTIFAFSTAVALFGLDSYKLWTISEEFYTILLEKRLQVALEMLEVGMCSWL